MDDKPLGPSRCYITGPAATASRKQYGPGAAVQVGGEWCWPVLTDEEIYRDRWL